MVFPVWEYSHSYGCSVTGGEIYRGSAIPGLQGTYFFGDYCTSKIWSFSYDGSSTYNYQDRTAELSPDFGSISSISGFGRDAAGEIYICDLGGEVFKIIPLPSNGACCIGTEGACIEIYETNCNAGGGTWLGADSDCASGGCDPNNCPADISGDGTVNVSDLLSMIKVWGPCSGCSADLNSDGNVDVTDLLEVVGAWGPCQ
jgi:hypothetical protein